MVGSWGALDKLQSRYDVFLPSSQLIVASEEERSNCFQQTTLGTWDLKPGPPWEFKGLKTSWYHHRII